VAIEINFQQGFGHGSACLGLNGPLKLAPMKTLVIINPTAGGGKARRKWPALQAALQKAIGPFEFQFTSAGRGAIPLAREAAQGGAARIIAAGGDGTVNEVVNGLCVAAGEGPTVVQLGILPLGTGNDFARGLGVTTTKAALAVLSAGKTRHVDVGRMAYSAAGGARLERWFANVASLGLIGEVVHAAQGSSLKRVLGSKLAYPLHAAQVLRRYRGHEIEIQLEDGRTRHARVLAAAIANGKFFGAGMKVAPLAELNDGLLDVLVAESTPKFRARDLRLLYSGKHLEHPAISHFKARRVRFAAMDGSKMLCETDGELQGHGPCDVEVVPGKLRVIV
jgi:diacylglycerol kinase (ATP)